MSSWRSLVWVLASLHFGVHHWKLRSVLWATFSQSDNASNGGTEDPRPKDPKVSSQWLSRGISPHRTIDSLVQRHRSFRLKRAEWRRRSPGFRQKTHRAGTGARAGRVNVFLYPKRGAIMHLGRSVRTTLELVCPGPLPGNEGLQFRALSTKEVSGDKKRSAGPSTHASAQRQIGRRLRRRLVRQGGSVGGTTNNCMHPGAPWRTEK